MPKWQNANEPIGIEKKNKKISPNTKPLDLAVNNKQPETRQEKPIKAPATNSKSPLGTKMMSNVLPPPQPLVVGIQARISLFGWMTSQRYSESVQCNLARPVRSHWGRGSDREMSSRPLWIWRSEKQGCHNGVNGVGLSKMPLARIRVVLGLVICCVMDGVLRTEYDYYVTWLHISCWFMLSKFYICRFLVLVSTGDSGYQWGSRCESQWPVHGY